MAKPKQKEEEIDLQLAESIKQTLDELAGKSDDEAKDEFRKIFGMLNFKPAFDSFRISFDIAGEHYSFRCEIIAETDAKEGESFRIIYTAASKITKTLRKRIVRELVEWEERFANFIVVIRAGNNWQIVSPVYIKQTDRLETRVYVVGEGQKHRTASLALAKLKLEKPGTPSIQVRELVNEAFKVKTLTEDFFEEYRRFYGKVRDDVLKRYTKAFEEAYTHAAREKRGYRAEEKEKRKEKEKGEVEDLPKEIFVARAAKTFTHSFLNRLMFIYFLQRKGWLAGKKNFIVWLWEKYESTLDRDSDDRPVYRDEFYSHYLRPLFFDAMNKPRDEKVGLFDHLPNDVAVAFENIPYFNGGLFERAREGDVNVDDIVVNMPDNIVKSVIFDFLEEYNFTVSEKLLSILR